MDDIESVPLEEKMESNNEEGSRLIHRNHQAISKHRNVVGKISKAKQLLSLHSNNNSEVIKASSFEEYVQCVIDELIANNDELQMGGGRGGEQIEQSQIETLKNLPQTLTIRRAIKERLDKVNNDLGKVKRISRFHQTGYSMGMKFKKGKEEIRDLTYKLELWYSKIKTIEGEFGSVTALFFKFFRYLFILNTICIFPCLFFIVLPQLLYNPANNMMDKEVEEQPEFNIEDIFTGRGFLTQSPLYFGYYTNSSVSSIFFPYSMSHGYFYTMLMTYTFIFLILAIRMAKSYRENFIEIKGSFNNVCAIKVFASWDYGIATDFASNLKSSAIFYELRALLSDKQFAREKCSKLLALIMIRISGNLLVLSILAGISFTLWTLLERHRTGSNIAYIGIITAAVMNGFTYLTPFVFTLISKYEDYKSPRTATYFNLGRTFLLLATNLGVLIAYWIRMAKDMTCWETNLGQEIYRLIIFDFLFYLTSIVLWEMARFSLYKRKIFYCKAPEFEMSRHTLQLVYNQTLFWLGLYFAPLLCVVIFLKYFINWYLISWVLLHVCKPSERSWRAAHTHTLFFIMVFCSLLCIMAVLGYVIASIPVSSLCGPFSGYDYVYSIIKNGFRDFEQGEKYWSILIYVTKPGVVAMILITLCCVIYSIREKTKVQGVIINEMKKLIDLEITDRKFLLKQLGYAMKVNQNQRFNTDSSIRLSK